MEGLARAVSTATGVRVRGATLAAEGSLESALAGLEAPVVFPHFMADGWFVSTNLQKRLAKAGARNWTTLSPLGLDPALPPLALARLASEMARADLPRGATTLVIAAHGSPSDPRPARATERFAARLDVDGMFGEVRVGYVDEAPALAEAVNVEGPALVLPFFAARAGHVLIDLPEALQEASFEGPVLPPIGTWDEIPDLIAQALVREVAVA